jgi:antitoxin (DNA-binding transcriptional repressor) of toxin-antitoxin stability system
MRALVQGCTLLRMTLLNVSEARAVLPELLDRVAGGEEITITRYGRPAAVLLHPDALRTRRAESLIRRARHVGMLVASAGSEPLAPGVLSAERAEELVEAVRSGRTRG